MLEALAEAQAREKRLAARRERDAVRREAVRAEARAREERLAARRERDAARREEKRAAAAEAALAAAALAAAGVVLGSPAFALAVAVERYLRGRLDVRGA